MGDNTGSMNYSRTSPSGQSSNYLSVSDESLTDPKEVVPIERSQNGCSRRDASPLPSDVTPHNNNQSHDQTARDAATRVAARIRRRHPLASDRFTSTHDLNDTTIRYSGRVSSLNLAGHSSVASSASNLTEGYQSDISDHIQPGVDWDFTNIDTHAFVDANFRFVTITPSSSLEDQATKSPVPARRAVSINPTPWSPGERNFLLVAMAKALATKAIVAAKNELSCLETKYPHTLNRSASHAHRDPAIDIPVGRRAIHSVNTESKKIDQPGPARWHSDTRAKTKGRKAWRKQEKTSKSMTEAERSQIYQTHRHCQRTDPEPAGNHGQHVRRDVPVCERSPTQRHQQCKTRGRKTAWAPTDSGNLPITRDVIQTAKDRMETSFVTPRPIRERPKSDASSESSYSLKSDISLTQTPAKTNIVDDVPTVSPETSPAPANPSYRYFDNIRTKKDTYSTTPAAQRRPSVRFGNRINPGQVHRKACHTVTSSLGRICEGTQAEHDKRLSPRTEMECTIRAAADNRSHGKNETSSSSTGRAMIDHQPSPGTKRTNAPLCTRLPQKHLSRKNRSAKENWDRYPVEMVLVDERVRSTDHKTSTRRRSLPNNLDVPSESQSLGQRISNSENLVSRSHMNPIFLDQGSGGNFHRLEKINHSSGVAGATYYSRKFEHTDQISRYRIRPRDRERGFIDRSPDHFRSFETVSQDSYSSRVSLPHEKDYFDSLFPDPAMQRRKSRPKAKVECNNCGQPIAPMSPHELDKAVHPSRRASRVDGTSVLDLESNKTKSVRKTKHLKRDGSIVLDFTS